MDSRTKDRSLARHAMFHAEHRAKRMHNGNAIEGKGGRMDVREAYEASGRGMDARGIERALNPHDNMPIDDEPMMHTEVVNSAYCMSYDELIPAVNRRVTVGDQLQPTPGHASWDMDMTSSGFEMRRMNNESF